ncbi:hypothetical protein [Jeotgalibacillus marinus]|uniref:Uncharacterized protein n=1 Tax=Jeotgalibacillus marinus TaxID=86667 RepID=A0ABV3Q8I8_9BACL
MFEKIKLLKKAEETEKRFQLNRGKPQTVEQARELKEETEEIYQERKEELEESRALEARRVRGESTQHYNNLDSYLFVKRE